ncbi:hypothetical protein Sgly_1346 [Syntrophobotulus glycolicus DSM 8271]|uniref:Uncharacterized protein n=1 Tax=Syntrophobotulus glycolicus (strain DSM 8271 / FlGlyR) TaxID=645991 RepID=F0SVU5_SYNGF|nr:hypothetical protein [Syntrophobotulus glycolicus]ADY55651.1 hypothetical protein Sgly_1346 [Syntrophobotulus glycolicus DSM 8271]
MIAGTIDINGMEYKWMECSRSLNRGILFNPDSHQYMFRPNPHQEDSKYYNKHQEDWYAEAVAALAAQIAIGGWIAAHHIVVNGVDYTANLF